MISAKLAKPVAYLSAAGIVSLWIDLAVGGPVLPAGTGGPLPDAAVPPVLLGVAIFSALAVAAGVAAFRDAPLVVVLSGAISLLPVGLYTLMLPWPHRLIGVLDAILVVCGVLLLRGADGSVRPDERPPPR